MKSHIKTVYLYVDGKRELDAVQWALDNDIMLADAKVKLAYNYRWADKVEFKVERRA